MQHTYQLNDEINPLSQKIIPVCVVYLLFQCRTIQAFRVACGKSSWHWWNVGDNRMHWNLREILGNEVVIEFDMPKDWPGDIDMFQRKISLPATHQTGINLYNAGLVFEIWDHNGKSPHIHIRNLVFPVFEKNKLKKFKEFFIKRFVPAEYHKFLDFSLCGIHLVALEGAMHWKGYGIKRLLFRFDPRELKGGIGKWENNI